MRRLSGANSLWLGQEDGFYLGHNVSVSMACCEMQRGIVTAVHHVNAGASHDEHVHHTASTLPARPVEGAKAMVISDTDRRMQADKYQKNT